MVLLGELEAESVDSATSLLLDFPIHTHLAVPCCWLLIFLSL